MDQLKIKNFLMLLGLTPLEQQIYLTVNTLGGCEVSEVAIHHNMSLGEVQPVVGSLTRRGIGYFTKSKDRQLLWVVNPEELEKMVKHKEEEMGTPRL